MIDEALARQRFALSMNEYPLDDPANKIERLFTEFQILPFQIVEEPLTRRDQIRSRDSLPRNYRVRISDRNVFVVTLQDLSAHQQAQTVFSVSWIARQFVSIPRELNRGHANIKEHPYSDPPKW